jgi:uncharacterized membrane protein YeaQ/YmgE (transglycosylase-associated protein family)
MGIIAWLVVGLIAGFIGSKIVNRTGEGLVRDILLGIIGAVIGGAIFERCPAPDRLRRLNMVGVIQLCSETKPLSHPHEVGRRPARLRAKACDALSLDPRHISRRALRWSGLS